MMPLLDINQDRVVQKFSDRRTMIGIPDGGADVDMLCNASNPTHLTAPSCANGAHSRSNSQSSATHELRTFTSDLQQLAVWLAQLPAGSSGHGKESGKLLASMKLSVRMRCSRAHSFRASKFGLP
jgi:hypothetical protein